MALLRAQSGFRRVRGHKLLSIQQQGVNEQSGFRRVRGHKQLGQLTAALARS